MDCPLLASFLILQYLSIVISAGLGNEAVVILSSWGRLRRALNVKDNAQSTLNSSIKIERHPNRSNQGTSAVL